MTDEVSSALAAGAAVVALESTIISHGLPRPENLRVAAAVEDIVRSRGAVPATIAILDGVVRIGLDEDALTQVATRDDIVKVSVRDLATLVATGGSGATTVAATSHLASRAGIGVFATGGLGGVHRQARETWDESADLTTLGSIAITIVCAGVKSILDVPATLERMETLNIGVLGFGTDRFPGFYLRDSGHRVDWSVDEPEEVAAIMAARRDLGVESGLVVANPLPEAEQVDPDLHDEVLTEGLRLAASHNVTGKDVTPFLLDHFHRASRGASLIANERIIVRNAELASRIAVAYSALP
jgi:pseudouridylate synthase